MRVAVDGAVGTWRDLRDVARSWGARGLALRLRHEIERRAGLLDRLTRRAAPRAAWQPVPVDLAPVRAHHAAEPALAAGAVADGERVLAGRIPYFHEIEIDSGWPPRWLEHPRTGRRWPGDRPWSELSTTDLALGDIKWIWEPARFGFAWRLARAAVAEGRPDRWCAALFDALDSFARTCPPFLGPNWYCGQETALRVITLEVVLGVLAALGWSPTERQRARIEQLHDDSGRRIDATLGHALSQRNNHALSELAGLWTIAIACPALPEAPAWRARVIAELPRALEDQVAADGAYIQESFVYHRLALHVLLLLRWLGERRGQEVPVPLDPVLERAGGFLRAFVEQESGLAPGTGANDGTRLVPLGGGVMRDMRPVLQHVAAALGQPAPFPPGPWDEEARWFGRAPATAAAPPLPPVVVSRSGYVASRLDASAVFLRVPAHTRHRPSHADALHVDVFLRGRELALDPGTYAYTAARPWDNGLARTRVHNTASVDDFDQMRRRGRFLWTRWTRARLLLAEERAGLHLLHARCDADPDGRVAHERLVVHGAAGVWVFDSLRADRARTLRVHWNLAGAWRQGASEDAHGMALDGDHAAARVVAGGPARLEHVRGEEGTARGWWSPTYGQREACSAVEATCDAATAAFATALAWGDTRPVWWAAAWRAWRDGRVDETIAAIGKDASCTTG